MSDLVLSLNVIKRLPCRLSVMAGCNHLSQETLTHGYRLAHCGTAALPDTSMRETTRLTRPINIPPSTCSRKRKARRSSASLLAP